MGEIEFEVFKLIALFPIFGAIVLILYGYNHQWLVDATPAFVLIGLLIALTIGIGRTVLNAI